MFQHSLRLFPAKSFGAAFRQRHALVDRIRQNVGRARTRHSGRKRNGRRRSSEPIVVGRRQTRERSGTREGSRFAALDGGRFPHGRDRILLSHLARKLRRQRTRRRRRHLHNDATTRCGRVGVAGPKVCHLVAAGSRADGPGFSESFELDGLTVNDLKEKPRIFDCKFEIDFTEDTYSLKKLNLTIGLNFGIRVRDLWSFDNQN